MFEDFKEKLQENPRELQRVEHPSTESYKPIYLAHGSDRIVFELPGHPNSVAKVSS